MKKFSVILLSILICITFFGCKGAIPTITDPTGEELTTPDGKVAIAVIDENGEVVTDKSGEIMTTMVMPVTDKNGELVTNEEGQIFIDNGEETVTEDAIPQTTEGTATTADNGGTKKTTTTKKAPTSAASSQKSTAKSTTSTTKKPSPSTTTTTKKARPSKVYTTRANKSITCTVIIDCSALIDSETAPDSVKKLVPSEGVMLDEYQVTVKDTETVADIIAKACDQNNIDLELKRSALGGTTISSIGGIKEKSCGNDSGWLYEVTENDNSVVGINCSKKTVKNGATIIFAFVEDRSTYF